LGISKTWKSKLAMKPSKKVKTALESFLRGRWLGFS